MSRLPPRIGSRNGAKPKILLLDDHPGVIEGVAATLADDFDVAGVGFDGAYAVDLARLVQPDAIVLDVQMPGLDGFRTIDALTDSGSRAPVVFLSLYDDDDLVNEAFRRGGRGYVQKSRTTPDLAAALDHALAGRLFLPTLSSLATVARDHGHAIQFQGDRAFSLEGMAAFLEQALRRGDATAVIASRAMVDGLEHHLRARGWNLAAPDVARRYRVVDADEAATRMLGNGLDERQFAVAVAELDQYRLAATGRADSHVTVVGDLSALMHERGRPDMARSLERVWNEVTRDLPMVTLCAYSAACLQHAGPDVWAHVYAEHDVICHARDL